MSELESLTDRMATLQHKLADCHAPAEHAVIHQQLDQLDGVIEQKHKQLMKSISAAPSPGILLGTMDTNTGTGTVTQAQAHAQAQAHVHTHAHQVRWLGSDTETNTLFAFSE